jgi:O-antigen/teichoic acid export membrane protein
MIKEQLNRLTKSTFIYGIGQVLNRFIGFLLLPLFTAYLSPADYGIIAILGLISFIAVSLFSLGVNGAVGICYFDENDDVHKQQTIWTTFFILLAGTFLLYACAFLFPHQISQLAFNTKNYADLIVMTLLTAGMTILTSPFTLYLQFEEKAKLFVVLTIVTTLFSIALSCALVIFFKRGVHGMVESTLVASMIGLFLFSSFTFFRLKVQTSRKMIHKLLLLGLPLVPSAFMVFVIQHGNKYILQYLSGLDAVGIYNIGFNLGMAMSLLVSALQSAWLPYFMSYVDKQEEAGILFGRILTYYVFTFGSVSLLFFIFAKPVIMIMTQPEFYEAYKVMGLSAGASFISGIFFILLPGIYFAKDVRYVTIVQIVSTAIAIVFNFVFIHLYGLLGAALALLLGFATMVLGLMVWNYLQKHRYVQVLYEWRRILQFSVIYVLYGVLMLWERHFSLPGELLVSLIATCLLPFFIYSLLKSNERTYFKSFYKRLRRAC